jgi:CheY-like chemotaxis protein
MAHAAQCILLVDDYPDTLEMYRLALEVDGFDVVTATSAGDGLRVARSKPVAAIVLDVHMPGVDGLGLMRALAADPHTRTIPRIVLTADARPSTEFEVRRAFNPAGYVIKPCAPDHLVAMVRSVIGQPS